MSKERYVEHTVAWELPIRDSVTKGNYNLADIETKYLPIQTEVVSDNKDKTINKLQQQIAQLKKQLEEKEKEIETKNIVNNLYKTTVRLRDNDFKDLVYENNSLKQQLNSQPAEIVEKIGGEIYTRMVVECKETKYTDINLILDTILKEYQKQKRKNSD